MDLQDLKSLMGYIDGRFVFTSEQYPGLPEDPGAALGFALKHELLHMNKSVGALASAIEACDHSSATETLAFDEQKLAVVKLLVTTLKTASLMGMSAEEIAKTVPAAMR